MTLAAPLRRAALAPRNALAGWRVIAAPRYRAWQAIAVGGAGAGAFAGGLLQLPLLLSLGMEPGAAWLLGLVPMAGSVAQPLFPGLLGVAGGRLRAVTIALYLVSESRAPLVAVLVAAHALGAATGEVTLWGIAALTVVAGPAGQLAGTGQRIWTWVVLPETERRLVAPRLGTLNAAANVVLLWIVSAAMAAGQGTGSWIYVACFLAGGVGSAIGLRGLLALPHPGSVRPPEASHPDHVAATAAFRNLLGSSTLAAAGAGLQPAIPLVALAVIHLPVSFTVTLGALGATVGLAGSMVGASLVAGRSASRLLRATHLARFGELVMVLVAIAMADLAPTTLMLAALLEAGTSQVNGIASGETLYRVSGPAIVAYQGRFSATTQTAYTMASFSAGALVASSAGPAAFVLLLGASAACRLGAARLLRVSPSWRE